VGKVAAEPPTITSVSPKSGPLAGQTAITITGTNLANPTSVTVGGAAATSITATATSITATTPAGTAGTQNVVVTTAGGSVIKTSAFTYVAAPTITSVSPATGPAAGGTQILIEGANLENPTSVTIGGAAAVVANVVADGKIRATTPAGTAGAQNIVVTTAGGSVTKAGGFTYVAATKLAFTAQPVSAVAGVAFVTQPVVTVQDAGGNKVTSFTGPVTISIKSNTGASGASLNGTKTVNAVAGVATFSGLSLDRAGAGYVLVASSSSLSSAEANTLTVTASSGSSTLDQLAVGIANAMQATPTGGGSSGGAVVATKLAFTTQPAGATAGTAFTTQPVVTIQDANGNKVSSFTGAVTIAIKSNTGASGAVLNGTKTVNAVAGVATFSGLSLDKEGSGYVLVASSGSLAAAEAGALTVAAALSTATAATPAGGQQTVRPGDVVELGELVGTPPPGFSRTLSLKLVIRNSNGMDSTLLVSITPSNSRISTKLTWTVPMTGWSGTLSITAMQENGQALPAWLAFRFNTIDIVSATSASTSTLSTLPISNTTTPAIPAPTNAAPTIMGFSSSDPVPDVPGSMIVATGTGFTSGTTIWVDGQQRPVTTNVSATQVCFQLPTTLKPGTTATIVAKNGDAASAAANFPVASLYSDIIQRLYRTYFGRRPDAATLKSWIDISEANAAINYSNAIEREVQKQQVLNYISDQMAASPEYVRASTGKSDAEKISQFYMNCFGRSGDPAGLAYWSQYMASGGTIGQVAIAFASSAEAKAVSLAAPTITSVTPAEGPAAGATTVTIAGTNLANPTSVTVGGVAATEITATATSITAKTPAGSAGAKDIVIVTVGDSVTMAGAFTYVAPLTITKFEPSPASPGATVTVTGTGFTNNTKISVNGTEVATTYGSATQVTFTLPATVAAGTTPTIVAKNGTVSSTTASGVSLSVVSPLTITGFSLASAAPGDQVTITGTGFTDQTTITIGGVAAVISSPRTSTSLIFTVPATVAPTTTPGISVRNGDATATLPTNVQFAITQPAASNNNQQASTENPTAFSSSAIMVKRGDLTVILGQLQGTWLPGRGTSATISISIKYANNTTTSFTKELTRPGVGGSTIGRAMIMAQNVTWSAVPSDAPLGPITITASNLPRSLTFKPAEIVIVEALTITGFSPTSAAPGTTVTVTGTGFTNNTKISINGTEVATTYVSATQVTFSLPATIAANTTPTIVAKNGDVSSTTASGVSLSIVAPLTITGFNPTNPMPGATVTVTGTGFTSSTKISVNGTEVATTYVSATQVTFTLPTTVAAGTTTAIIAKNGDMTSITASGVSLTIAAPPTNTAASTPSTSDQTVQLNTISVSS